MVKIIEGNLFDSNANFIIHQVNCQGIMGSGVALQVSEIYPHVFKEYAKYVRYCNKNNIKILGTVQYVPCDVWALGMVDTMKNDVVIDYDTDYQYIVNLFGQDSFGTNGVYTDLKSFANALTKVKNQAEKIGASIAMPYKIGSHRGGANWNDVYAIIKKIFENSIVDVELWKYIMD